MSFFFIDSLLSADKLTEGRKLYHLFSSPR